jgi:hypothetical protein
LLWSIKLLFDCLETETYWFGSSRSELVGVCAKAWVLIMGDQGQALGLVGGGRLTSEHQLAQCGSLTEA